MYLPVRHIESVFWKKNPIHLTLFLTKRCNSLCPFCFYLRKKGAQTGEELSLDEIKKISLSSGRLLWVAFSGGEIYLRDDLVEISRAFYENNRPSIMLYPTNGLLTDVIREKTEEILRLCPKSVVAVKLSMDGLDGRHDSLRGVKGGFERLMRTYESLSGLLSRHPNFELGINTVFCSANQDEIEGIMEFVNRMENIKTHTVTLVRGDLEEQAFKDVDYGKYASVIGIMEENLKKKASAIYRFWGARLKAAQDILQRRLILRTMLEGRRILPCFAGRLNIVVTETAEVYPCEPLEMSMGNLREHSYDLRALTRGPEAKKALKHIGSGKCFCSHECYLMTNILFNPKTYPALLRQYVHLF